MRRRNRNNDRKVPKTEWSSAKALAQNARQFCYPPQGFVHKVEQTLLYSMLSFPKIYPKTAVLKEIEETDYHDLMIVDRTDGELCSYAQLQALLTLAIRKWSQGATHVDLKKRCATVPQQLYQTLMQTVITHARRNNMDREDQLRLFFQPLSRSNNRAVMRQFAAVILPYYVGLGISVMTLNPLPGLIGYAATLAAVVPAERMMDRNDEVRQMKQVTQRSAKVENIPLLEETENGDDEEER